MYKLIGSSVKQGKRFAIFKVQEQVIHTVPASMITNQNHEQKQEKLDREDMKKKKRNEYMKNNMAQQRQKGRLQNICKHDKDIGEYNKYEK